jgi:two-component system response regulator HydG
VTKILVADDDRSTREALEDILTREGYDVHAVGSGPAALEQLARGDIDIVLVDLVMPDVNGLEILKAAHEKDASIKVLLCTGYGTIETAVDAMRQGAFHYLTKPVKPVELKAFIKKAVEEQRLQREKDELERENQALKSRLDDKYGFENVIGNSPAISRIIDLVRRVASTRSTVLLTGESGTGKERIASCLHQNSPRRKAAFVRVNCAAIAESLLESELFGHVAGAYTGAIRDREGRFEAAHGGTILLDEIDKTSLATQAKFLRVLQEGELERVGEVRVRKVDVRVIAATNRNLEDLVAKGEFREDLYYRLKVVRIELPPLRDRREDIPLFVDAFLKEHSQVHGRPVQGVAPDVMERLMAYPWPGNVRELKNVLEAMVVTTRNAVLQYEDLPPELAAHKETAARLQVPVGATLDDIEREMIRRTMAKCQDNRTRAAKMLGVSLRTLQRKLKRMDGEESDGDEEDEE